MSSKVRPTGITILVILEVLGAIGLLIGGLAFAAFGGFIYQYIPSGTVPPALWAGIVAFGGAIFLIGSLICFLIAWGLWTGKGWSWYVAFIFAILGAIGGLFSLPGGIVGLAINGLIIWYLWQPNVKAFFGMGAPTTTIPPPPLQPSTTQAGNVIYCSKCGTPNPIGSAFCKNCGAELKT